MNRRKTIKALFVGGISTATVLNACDNKPSVDKVAAKTTEEDIKRMSEELVYDEALNKEKFFNEHEMLTIAVLADIIVPKDDISPAATDVGVPEFIEFMVKDRPEYKIPMRGGLKWMDMYCLNNYAHPFIKCSPAQQLELVEKIAYPEKALPQYQQGTGFFSLMRNFTISGFYTTKAGFADLGYVGNTPNQWNGVPADVLKQYGVAYSEKELKECASY